MSEKRYERGGDGSHWDGCAEVHWDCKIVLLETEKAYLKSIIAGKDQTLSEIAMELAYLSEGHKTMYAVEVYWKFASENFEYGLIQADTLAEANAKMRAMYPDAIQILIRELEFNEQGYFTIYEH